uniref:F-protein n=1 Tax=Cryptophlebia leucotreta granulosis virus TaxID=35254 RepID=A0A2H4ZK75_GVCL|nr:hypothetical protein [Cryptophlebia leucotreta granulovirus]
MCIKKLDYFYFEMIKIIPIFFYVICGAQNIGDYVHIQPISDTGFHYEFQNQLGFVVNTWSFILNIEYVKLKNRLADLQNITAEIHQAFDNTLINCSANYQSEVDYILNEKIGTLFDTHNSIEFLLIHKRLPKQTRRKRGLFGGAFNFVGRFYKYTLGVMDDRDAALLYEVAENANNTEFRVKTLTNETINLVKYVNSLRYALNIAENCESLDRKLVHIKDNLDDIESTYNKIIAGIQMALYSNRLSSLIMNPRILLDEMKSVDSNLWDNESEWVVKPSFEQMHSIMRMVQCNVFINPRDELMFVIQVPRIDKSKYMLYKPVPLPECDNNKICKFIPSQSQYIGFEMHKSKHYIRLDDTSTCNAIDNITLCYGSMTTKKIMYSPNCDVKLFKGLHHNNCEVHATRFHSEIFYSLNNVNRWLYMVIDKPVHAELNCGSGRYDKQITLNGTGILTLLKYCKLRTSRSLLISKHVANYEQETFAIVKFNFSNFLLPPDGHLGNKVAKNLDFDSLNDITKNLQRLLTREETDAIINLPSPDDNSNANWYSNLFGNWWWELKFIMYVFCVLILLTFVFYLKRIFCSGQNVVLPILSPR